MTTHHATECATKIRHLQEQQTALLQSLITSDPEEVLLAYLSSSPNIELRELAALQGYSQSFRLKAIELLNNNSSYTLERIAEHNPDSKEAQAAQNRLKKLQSLRHKAKSLFIRFSKE